MAAEATHDAMSFAFTEEQEELREMARAFLAEVSSGEQVRAAMETTLGHDPELWKRIGKELGWPAVIVPEAHGGLGLSDVELAALMETMGEAVLCAPFFATVALAATAILAAGTDAQKSTLLPAIAEGDVIATLAAFEANGRWDAAGVEATWRRDGDEVVLDGTKRHVVDGHCADLLIVAARATGTSGEDGISLFAVPADTPGLTRTALPTMDQTRRLAEVTLTGLRVPADARLGDEDGSSGPALSHALQRATVALAAEQLGVAQRSLDQAVAYAKEREQFGRVIGAFQSIKHKCADMMIKLESARSLVYAAACVAAEGADTLPEMAAAAKAAASEAAFFCAGSSLQIHGGVGFTWEYDVHLYFKRARSSTTLLGDAAWHREQVARRIGL